MPEEETKNHIRTYRKWNTEVSILNIPEDISEEDQKNLEEHKQRLIRLVFGEERANSENSPAS